MSIWDKKNNQSFLGNPTEGNAGDYGKLDFSGANTTPEMLKANTTETPNPDTNKGNNKNDFMEGLLGALGPAAGSLMEASLKERPAPPAPNIGGRAMVPLQNPYPQHRQPDFRALLMGLLGGR